MQAGADRDSAAGPFSATVTVPERLLKRVHMQGARRANAEVGWGTPQAVTRSATPQMGPFQRP